MDNGSSLLIPAPIWLEMACEAQQHSPEEACGLLAGKNGRVEYHFPIPNELHSPTRFRMNAQSQVRAFIDIESRGSDLIAIWHSHPQGPPYPSQTDIAEFAYPGSIYLIWVPCGPGKGDLGISWAARGFRIEKQSVCEVLLKVE